MIAIYRAFDGKEFNDADECENYEEGAKVAAALKNKTFHLTSLYSTTPFNAESFLTDPQTALERLREEPIAFRCENEEILSFLRNCFDPYNEECFETKTDYVYEDDSGWVELEDVISNLEADLEFYKEIREKLK